MAEDGPSSEEKKWQTVLCNVEQQQNSTGFPQKTLLQLQDTVFWLIKQEVKQGSQWPDSFGPTNDTK